MKENSDRQLQDFDLQRFMDAQANVYLKVVDELRAGRKRSHWMWFVFPQIQGLGRSHMAVRYSISGREEARCYLTHPVLGRRLVECTGLVDEIEGTPVEQIFGFPDYLKFRSCMTLFTEVSGEGSIFQAALDTHYAGSRCEKTLEILAKEKGSG